MNTPNVWSLLVVMGCVVTIVRLVTFRRGASRHRATYAWLAWGLIALDTYIAVRCAAGVRPPPGPLTALAMLAIAALVVFHRGDLAHLHRSSLASLAAMIRGEQP